MTSNISMRRQRDRRPRVIVVGGGITGFSAAYRLSRLAQAREQPLEICLLESSNRIGGQIRTERNADCLLEGGPDSMVAQKPAGLALCRELGLDDEIIHTRGGPGGVHVAHQGRLVQLPRGFFMMAPTRVRPLLSSPLFSWAGKVRMACEPLIPARRGDDDESLRSFVLRRFGREAFERAAEPIVAGLFTADADSLSLDLSVPRFREMERKHGSVVAGVRKMLKSRAGGPHAGAVRKSAGFFTLRSGLGRLVEELAGKLPAGSLVTGASVDRLAFDPVTSRWSVAIADHALLEADALIMACPAPVASRLLQTVDGSLARKLGQIEYASCATVNMVYRRSQIGGPLDSFGFFVPRTEGLPLLATSHVSVKFEGRVADDRVLLRAFLGGALHPDLLDHDEAGLTELAQRTMGRFLDIDGAPLLSVAHNSPHSMPQYRVGDRNRLAAIATRAEELPGLRICGGSAGAVGLPDCISSGDGAARATLAYLDSGSHGKDHVGTDALSATGA
jgi:oxygen-dependent protoporphyrinogen oxidase